MRRIITGHRDGKSAIIDDAEVPAGFDNFGMQMIPIWKTEARPSMEGCGIDVYQTARNNGFFIKTLSEKTETQNAYCLMLVD